MAVDVVPDTARATATEAKSFGISGEQLLRRWTRGALGLLLGAAFGVGLVVVLRTASGLSAFQSEQTGYPQVIVPLVTGSLGFLLGFGAFSYWIRWALGLPTKKKSGAAIRATMQTAWPSRTGSKPYSLRTGSTMA